MTTDLYIWELTRILAAVSFIIQALEMWSLRQILSNLLNNKNLKYFLLVQIVASVLLLFNSSPWIWGLEFFCLWLNSIRWRGSFNGGSDYLSIIIALCGFIGSLFPQYLTAALYYLAIQTLLSYFLSGISKITIPEWKNGRSLNLILNNPQYQISRFIKMKVPKISRPLAYITILWEILFPLGILYQPSTIYFLVTGILFHLINFYLFGLNRFFWVWISTYPCLFWFSQKLALFV